MFKFSQDYAVFSYCYEMRGTERKYLDPKRERAKESFRVVVRSRLEREQNVSIFYTFSLALKRKASKKNSFVSIRLFFLCYCLVLRSVRSSMKTKQVYLFRH